MRSRSQVAPPDVSANYPRARNSYWRQMPRLELWKAVALSLDVEPDSVDPHEVDSPITECWPLDLRDRLTIALANFRRAGPLVDLTLGDWELLPQYREVGMGQFGWWAKQDPRNWSLPDWFPVQDPVIATLFPTGASQPTPPRPTEAPAPAKKELTTRERGSMHRVIAALLSELKVKPDDRGLAKRIAVASEEVGEAVDEETVRNILKQVAGMLGKIPN